MILRLARGLFAALLVAALIAVPVLAIRSVNPPAEQRLPAQVGDAEGSGEEDSDTDEKDEEGKGPPWAKDGDGPPFGNAWGYWLNKGGEEACERIVARMQTHRGEGPPADLRDRITNELGCDLPE